MKRFRAWQKLINVITVTVFIGGGGILSEQDRRPGPVE